MTRLSERLQLVYTNLIPGQDVWDFCCDHGYLGGAAYKSRQFKNIYFIDPASSIIEKLERQFKQFLFDAKNESIAYFLLQHGESVTQPIRGTACILGVGAILIYNILNELALNKHLEAQRLILGPHRDGEKLLSWIENNKLFENYELTSQQEVIENNRSRLFYIFDLKAANEL